MKDLETKNRKKMLKKIGKKDTVLGASMSEKINNVEKYRDFLAKQQDEAKQFPVSFKIHEDAKRYQPKEGGVRKMFTALNIGDLLRKSCGVKPASTCLFKWSISTSNANDNCIELVEILGKDEVQKPKRDLNFAQAFIAFLLIVFIGVTVIDIAFTIEKIKAEKLATCELRGDCVEVIKNINK